MKLVIQGVKTKATMSEISMPVEALIGMGLMYGPMSPGTKAMGSRAAMTVKVARMVGPPVRVDGSAFQRVDFLSD